jgi:hypothetical protein
VSSFLPAQTGQTRKLATIDPTKTAIEKLLNLLFMRTSFVLVRSPLLNMIETKIRFGLGWGMSPGDRDDEHPNIEGVMDCQR